MMRGDQHFALDWIRSELYETLTQIREALEAYAADGDEQHARACLTGLHQVHGTLMMLELSGVAVLSDHMERLAERLAAGGVEDTERVSELLMQGVIELPALLEEIRGGGRDDVAKVRRLTDQLRDALGEGPLRPESAALTLSSELSDSSLQRFRDIDGIDSVALHERRNLLVLSYIPGDVRNS